MTVITFFFRCFGRRLCSKTKIHGPDRFHGNSPYWKNPDRERTNQSARICLKLVLPHNNNCSVRTATTSGQYSLVRPEQARLVSCLLDGTLFLIVKCNGTVSLMIWHSVSNSKMQLQKRFVTESDKSSC